jgi:hypothetical protein
MQSQEAEIYYKCWKIVDVLVVVCFSSFRVLIITMTTLRALALRFRQEKTVIVY